MLRTLPFRGATLLHPARSRPGITFATPVSPQPAFAPILVSGTYRGTPAGITLVWRQGGADVGAPVAATSIENGLWSATITTPSVPGSYTLRASFDGTSPIADSAPIEIGAAQAGDSLATFTFEGTGAPADTITLFGHAFEKGSLAATDPVVLRRTDTSTKLRIQMNVLSAWEDGSVKTALMAAELPALADQATLAADFVRGEAHPDPGSDLDLATALAGRSAVVRSWAPGNTTTPLWSFDPLAALGADRWHEGPLALSTRAETPMPASANTSGIESVRLIVDVVVTRDGTLELDVCFSNDRLPYTSQDQKGGGYANCGPATFGYTIEIDGQVVYDQRPASGAATTLLQYSQWIRRRGRRTDGTVIGWSNHRPFARPDFAALVKSGVQPNYLTVRPVDAAQIDHQISQHINAGATKEADPYWTWSINRGAGDVGGRPEIGYRTFSGAVWLTSGLRTAQFLTERMFEAAATRAMYYRDWEDKDWINPPGWPHFTIATQGGTSPPGTPKSVALSCPLTPTHTQSEHITIDHAHHGAFNFPIALLLGRRIAYDGMAARAAWIVMDNRNRHVPNSGVPPLGSPPAWRGTVTPDHETGAAWGPRFGYDQTRTASWDLRCLVDAANILPDTWPNRTMYDRHAEAFFAAYAGQIAEVNARWSPEVGTPFFNGGASGNRAITYQLSFATPTFVVAQRCDVGGKLRDTVIANVARAQVGWVREPSFNFRNWMSGRSLAWSSEDNRVDAKTWADIQVFTASHSLLGDTSEDWMVSPGEGDWLRNGNMALVNIAYALDVPLDIKAMAADAAVLTTSERIRPETGAANRPTAEPQSYYYGNFQTNALWPVEVTSERNAAPVIPTGQSFNVSGGASNGTVVGVVRTSGVLPRQSAPGRNADDAFVIAAQPAGNPLAISSGGVLRVANRAAMPTSSFTIQVYCRTWEQRGLNDPTTEHRSATVAATVNPVMSATSLTSTLASWDVPANTPVGAVVGTLEVGGTEPITVTVVSGDPNGLFAVDASGTPRAVRVRGDMAAFAGASYVLRFRAEGPGGSTEHGVPVNVTASVTPPAIPDQTLTIAEGSPAGTAASPQLVNGGGAAASLVITAGDPDGKFTAAAPNLIASAGRLARLEQGAYTLGVEASNVMGSDVATVTVNLTPASYVYALPNTGVLAAVSAARRLRPGYTGPLLRAYRADGAEQDIGFGTGGLLDLAALTGFASGQQCRAALYDQSPMEQGLMTAHTGGLPFITDAAGQIYPFGANNRPSLRFEAARGLCWPSFRTGGTSDFGVMMAVRRSFSESTQRVLVAMAPAQTTSPVSTTTSFLLRLSNVPAIQLLREGTGAIASSTSNTLPDGTTTILGGYTLNQASRRRAISLGTSFWNANDTAAWAPMNATAHFNLGGRSDTANLDWVGLISEMLVFGPIDLAADQPAVRTDMAGFYGA